MRLWWIGGAIASWLALSTAARGEEPVEVVLELTPVANLQIAVWLETPEGAFVNDVFVTDATGRRGLGNRPGRWDFLSSWRMVYGPRPQVLPVWAHRRQGEYPRLVFADPDPADQESIGWHENASSLEPYYCRPLTADEQVLVVDTMTCPSPSTFRSDKGRFAPGETSRYPPRADLTEIDPSDHPDVMDFAALNDLDAVTAATPEGDILFTIPVTVDRDGGPLVAWIEVNLEHDENDDWDYTREDHFVDPRLEIYGIEYFGQPSVVYRVAFDPAVPGRVVATEMVGYGSFDGESGGMNPLDGTISAADGSGQDRLRLTMIDGSVFRFAVDVPESTSASSSGGADETSTSSTPTDDGSSTVVGTGSSGDSAGALADRGCACTTAQPTNGLGAWCLLFALVMFRRRC